MYDENPALNKKADGAGNAETLDAFPLKLGVGNMLLIAVCVDLEIFTNVIKK